MRAAFVLVVSPLVALALASAAAAEQPAQVTVTVQQPGQPARPQGQPQQPAQPQGAQPQPAQATPSPPSAQVVGAPGVQPLPNQVR